MSTLQVDNIPDDLYRALEERARLNGRPVSAEVLSILRGAVRGAAELEQRAAFVREVGRIRESGNWTGPGPTTEEMLREDRER